MKFVSKILGVLLVAALVVASFVTDAFAADNHSSKQSPSQQQPVEGRTGCHAHTTPRQSPQSQLLHSPSSTPVNYHYHCCVTGHNAAIVQTSQFQQPSYRWTRLTYVNDSVQLNRAPEARESSSFISTEPPESTPLRI